MTDASQTVMIDKDSVTYARQVAWSFMIGLHDTPSVVTKSSWSMSPQRDVLRQNVAKSEIFPIREGCDVDICVPWGHWKTQLVHCDALIGMLSDAGVFHDRWFIRRVSIAPHNSPGVFFVLTPTTVPNRAAPND